jgi:dTDP-4-dehydrorhamnose 3,5-epimerase
MIAGVEIKLLEKRVDPRGYFMELIREDDVFFDGDYWRVPVGLVRAVLCDLRPDSSSYRQIDEYLLGDDQEPRILRIPPGVAHGCKVLQGPALLTYVTSHVYNPADEGRIAYDDEQIGYDWGEVIK